MLTIEAPLPLFSIAGRKARMVQYMLLTLRVMVKSQSFSVHSSTVP